MMDRENRYRHLDLEFGTGDCCEGEERERGREKVGNLIDGRLPWSLVVCPCFVLLVCVFFFLSVVFFCKTFRFVVPF